MNLVRSIICRIRGRHHPEVAVDPHSGYYSVCTQCGWMRLLLEFDQWYHE